MVVAAVAMMLKTYTDDATRTERNFGEFAKLTFGRRPTQDYNYSGCDTTSYITILSLDDIMMKVRFSIPLALAAKSRRRAIDGVRVAIDRIRSRRRRRKFEVEYFNIHCLRRAGHFEI